MSLLCRRGQHRAALLLHNPSCSKSRAALGLLQQSGAAFDTREYLREPLSLVELEELQARLGQPVRWTRRADPAWAERFGDADAVPSNEACLRALVEVPTLLERPIFVHGAFAAVGRPPELVLALVYLLWLDLLLLYLLWSSSRARAGTGGRYATHIESIHAHAHVHVRALAGGWVAGCNGARMACARLRRWCMPIRCMEMEMETEGCPWRVGAQVGELPPPAAAAAAAPIFAVCELDEHGEYEATLAETPSEGGAERLAAHMRAQQGAATPAIPIARCLGQQGVVGQQRTGIRRYAVRWLDMARAFDLQE